MNTGKMQQQSLPLAFVRGEQVLEKPKELFIPEQAMAVQLDTFEGPLDLLLYLIKKQQFDIADLPISPITKQYLAYLDQMKDQGIELAADYLVMAATLTQIKSQLLLPKPVLEEDEIDPRAELMRKLQEYQSIKQASSWLTQQEQVDKDIFIAQAELADCPQIATGDELVLKQLVDAFQQVMQRQAAFEHHHISREAISCKEKMVYVLSKLDQHPLNSQQFSQLIDPAQGRQGVVVTFMAVLELIKSSAIEMVVGEKQNHGEFMLRKVS